MSAQRSYAPTFTSSDARAAGRSYQHLAHIVDRILNHILNTLDEKTARKYFKPSLFSTVHSLHGFFNGRDLKKKDLIVSAQFVAPHFHYYGNPENAGQFIGRHLDVLADAEFVCGLQLIEVKRADNVTLLYPHYISHPLLDVAQAVYQAARNNPLYGKNPSAAVTDELITSAVEMLPKVDPKALKKWQVKQNAKAKGEADGGGLAWDDEKFDAVQKSRWTRWQTSYAEILADETFKGGKNPRVVFEQIVADLKKVAEELYDRQCREIDKKKWSEAGTDVGGIMDAPLSQAPRPAIHTKDDEQDGYNNGLHPEPVEASETAAPEAEAPLKNDGGAKNEAIEFMEVSEPESMETWALNWAGLGVPVVPMHEVFDGICSCLSGSECRSAGKHPRTRNGAHDATTDEAQIKRWWKRWPTANVAGAMGGSLRWLCVDVDPRSGGDANLCSLVEAHGDEWLGTLHHKTGSGGDHLFFTIPEGVEFTKGKLADGIDLKWTGGLAVLPPSLHSSGRQYSIERAVNPRPAPEWLIEELTRPADAAPSVVVDFQERRAHTGCYGTRTFHEGERDNGIRDVAYGRWINGWAESESDLITQLLEVNATRCVPPLEQSVVIEKARRTARRFVRGELKREASARA